MQYRHLGRWGVRVSSISLGSWLTFGGSVDKETAIRSIRHAYELGINLFDTANAYNRGAAEEVVGEALRPFPRESYVLATKVYFPMGEGPNDRGLSRKHVVEQCNASLKRLGVEYIDLYQCHRYDSETPLEETLLALDDLIRQGKILYAGVSEWSASRIAEAMEVSRQLHLHPLVSNQPHYNMLQRDIEAEVMPTCARYGLGLIVYSPLAQGVLTGKYKPGQAPPAGSRATDPNSNMFMNWLLQGPVLAKVQRLQPVAERLGLTLAQLALAWILRRPEVSSTIIGATRPEQIDENVKAADVTLSTADLEEIEKILA
ncbi:MAG: aldo/keto reductase family protein [Limnochordaceae bacterium]|nr:aldo/keto reductase family protein [Limnochordaceae bacterium]